MKNFSLLLLKSLLFALGLVIGISTFGQNTCATATEVHYTNSPTVVSGSTTGVTNDNNSAGTITCGTTVGAGPQKWYKFTWSACTSHSITLSTDNAGTNYDTKLHVYTGSCGSLGCVGGDDDAGVTIADASIVTFTAQPGTTYLIRVGGFGLLSGNFVMSIQANQGGCMDPAACNFTPGASWDNCSCCYSDCATLTLNQNGYTGPESYIEYESDGVYYGPVHPGGALVFCEPINCDASIHVVDAEGNGWGGVEYSLTINGITVNNVLEDREAMQYYTSVQSPWCGCTDTDACNFEATATHEDGSCIYRTNGDCEDAQLLTSQFIHATTLCEPPSDSGVPCLTSSQTKDLWYKFVYNGGTSVFEVHAYTQDLLMAIWDDCGGNLLYCDNNYNQNFSDYAMLSCSNGLVHGHTYYLQVGTYYYNHESDLYIRYRTLPIPGCADPLALNFNECVSADDGSCIYEQVESCVGDLDHNGVVDVNDILQVIGIFGHICP